MHPVYPQSVSTDHAPSNPESFARAFLHFVGSRTLQLGLRQALQLLPVCRVMVSVLHERRPAAWIFRCVSLTLLGIHMLTIRAVSVQGFARHLPGRLSLSSRQGVYFTRLYSSTEERETSQDSLGPWTPWNHPLRQQRSESKRASRNKNRVRQHVNPLASQYQKQTVLPADWPHSVFQDPSLPLHVDIGCGKAGFLFQLAESLADGSASVSAREPSISKTLSSCNHLGLEIRPAVVELVRDRLGRRGVEGRLDIIGCNANVDLDRILTLYPGPLQLVTIQFPDPHFKAYHAKRRVVRPELVQCVAKHLPMDGIVFLQSDVQSVLDDMRERFAEFDDFFVDCSPGEYIPENPLGVPTEREVSVLERELPVYRAMFKRKGGPP